MNTISFSNAFKSLMATLGAKTTDSNYAVPLVNKTSGAPQGFMDMSSLASVLGGQIPLINEPDALLSEERFLQNGRWYFPSNVNDLPEVPDMSFLETIKYNNNRVLQRLTNLSTRVMYLRVIASSSGTLSRWYKFTGEIV